MAFARCRIAVAATAAVLWSGPLAAQAGEGEARARAALVGGRIVDYETGAGVSGATISLTPRAAGVRPMLRTTDAEGGFEFLEVPGGSYALKVESLGYHPFDDALEVAADSDVRLEIRVSASPLDLEPIVVVTARRPAFMDGFEARRSRGRNHTAFFTAEEIAAKNPNVLSDLFVTVPGAYVEPGLATRSYTSNALRVAGTPNASALRGGCVPDVWVNGVLNDGLPVDEMLQPDRIEAIELYTLQHEVPQRFEGPRRCGALVIWLRDRRPDERRLPDWKRWLLGLGALGATILLTR